MDVNMSKDKAAGLTDHLGWLFRRWWIVVILTMFGLALGFGYASVQPKAYDSMTPVLVQAPEGDGSKVDLDTEAQVVPTAAVAAGAQKLLGTSLSITDLIKNVSVTVPANTAILDITYEASTRAEAQKGSQAFAQAYLDQRAAVAQKALDTQKANLQDSITTLNNQLKAVAGQIATEANGSAAKQQAQQQQTILSNQITQATNRLQPLQAITITPGSILSPANYPVNPSKPNVQLYLASGLVVGLLLGLSGALLIARLDTRIYSGSDVPQRPDVPLLMEIRPGRQRADVADAASPLGREFSLLRNVLRFAAGSSRGGRPSTTDTLLLCSAVPGPAAGFVTANLAAAFARSGERVAIVCTDPDSTVPSVLGVSARYGLGEVLAGEIKVGDALQNARNLPGVSVLTSGQLDPRLELPVATVSELMHRIQKVADRVLIAASAPSSAVDAQALSEIAAAVVLVVETKRSHVPQVDAALDQFSRVLAPVAGIVVVSDHWKLDPPQPVVTTGVDPARVVPVRLPEDDASAETKIMSAVKVDSGDAVDATQNADGSQPTKQFRGWRARTGDSTVVLPKVSDVEDPVVEEWGKTTSMEMFSLRNTRGTDER
jgi:capsular polysaccharide biosynthesis protein/MinD-like ATPase involved in chromosome partitioning or flagellar assembly